MENNYDKLVLLSWIEGIIFLIFVALGLPAGWMWIPFGIIALILYIDFQIDMNYFWEAYLNLSKKDGSI